MSQSMLALEAKYVLVFLHRIKYHGLKITSQ